MKRLDFGFAGGDISLAFRQLLALVHTSGGQHEEAY